MWLLGVILACQDDKNTEDSATSSDLGEVEYYEAQTWITLESSGHTFDEQYLVKRTLDEDNSQIVEEFYSTIDGTYTSVTLDVDVQAFTFTLTTSMNDSVGEGTFEGEGLQWSTWESNVQHTDGTFEIAHNYKDAEGIHSSRVGYGMDNRAAWTLDEILTPIDGDAWQTAFANLPN